MSQTRATRAAYVAAAALTAHLLLKLNSAGKLTPCTARYDRPLSMSTADAAADTTVGELLWGESWAVASGAIPAGSALMPAAAGKVAAHDGAGGSTYVGYAARAAADGETLPIFYIPDTAPVAVHRKAILAAGTLTATQLLKDNGAGKLTPTTAKTEVVLGVAAAGAAADETVDEIVSGVALLTASGAIDAGEKIMPGAAGAAVAHDGATGSRFVGEALTAAADGAAFLALLYNYKLAAS